MDVLITCIDRIVPYFALGFLCFIILYGAFHHDDE